MAFILGRFTPQLKVVTQKSVGTSSNAFCYNTIGQANFASDFYFSISQISTGMTN